MTEFRINIIQTAVDSVGRWTASVARTLEPKGASSKVAIGESLYYQTKNQAWESISRQVSKLDFENDRIIFNHERVASFNEVEQKVSELKER